MNTQEATRRGLTREAAAAYAGVSVYKIKAAIRDNNLVARQHGKDIVVFREDLDEWMNTWEVVA